MKARRPVLAALLLLLVAGLVALGVWQLQRRTWKLALIAQVERRLAAPPVMAPGPERWDKIGKDDAYTRVLVRGHWRPVAPVLTQATTALGGGYWVMAPLDADRGFTVLVNRGFVAPENKRDLTPPVGDVTVTGLLRISEPNGGFLRHNVPAENRWYSRDVAAIASNLRRCPHPSGASRLPPSPIGRGKGPAAAGGGKGEDSLMGKQPARPLKDCVEGDGKSTAPYFIDADALPNIPYPRGGMTVIRFPNNHLVYALTWFAMAGLLAFATWRVARPRADA